MANVFNTFSFNKWADNKREEEIDKESRRRRHEQIKRLKDKLRRERELRELGGDGDMDMEALIEALQMGEDIYANPNPWENWHNGKYNAGKDGSAGGPGGAGQNGRGYGSGQNGRNGGMGNGFEENGEFENMSDEYILGEIKNYSKKNGGIEGFADKRAKSAAAKGAGCRGGSGAGNGEGDGADGVGPQEKQVNAGWQFNRKYAELMAADQRTSSAPSTPGERRASARGRASSATRVSSAPRSASNKPPSSNKSSSSSRR